MAYLTYLAAVPKGQLDALCRDASYIAEPSLVVAVSHLIAYWVELKPLGQILGEAVDGGTEVSDQLWHPLRTPKFHTAEKVSTLFVRLSTEWDQIIPNLLPNTSDDWYRVEIEKVLRLFGHAAGLSHCVLSALEPPADRRRAKKIRIPMLLETAKK